MTVGAIKTLLILLGVLILLVTNKVRIDIIALLLFLALYFTGLVPSHLLFSGFSSEAVILIASMFVMGEALVKTGITDRLASLVAKLGNGNETRLAIALMFVASLASAFVSDVGLVAIFMPAVFGLEKKTKVPASRLLLPLAIAAMLGGLLTLVGTSSSIIANEIMIKSGYPGWSVFNMTPLGFVLVITGIVYMLFIGRFQIPNRRGEFVVNVPEVKQYLTHVTIQEGSPWVGETLADIKFLKEHDISVVRIMRKERSVFNPGPQDVLQAGDVLLVRAAMDHLVALQEEKGLEVEADRDPNTHRLQTENVHIAEAMLLRPSPLIGRTLAQTDFRGRFGLTVLAIWRKGSTLVQKLDRIRFDVGDVLLLQGSQEAASRLERFGGVVLLSEHHHEHTDSWQGWLALVILLGVLLAAAFNYISITVAGVLGVTLMVATKLITMRDAYAAVEWKVLVLIASMIPLGTAMQTTGILTLLAHGVVQFLGPFGSYALLAGFFVIAALLTQVLSNFATALLLTPVAISTAKLMHYHPDPLVMAVVAAVSASPITPVSNKVNLLVMGPGGYKYGDYLRMGIPLTFVLFLVSMVFIPIWWPF